MGLFIVACAQRVPDAVVKKYLWVKYGGVPLESLKITTLNATAEKRAFEGRKREQGQLAELPRIDELTDADRANGATDRYLVEWSAVRKGADGAEQVQDAAVFTRHSSGLWLTPRGIFDARGQFARTRDLAGTYRAEIGPDRSYFADCVLTLNATPEHSGSYQCSGKNGRKTVRYGGPVLAAVVVEAEPKLRNLVSAASWTYIIARDAEGEMRGANLEVQGTKLVVNWDVQRGLAHGGEATFAPRGNDASAQSAAALVQEGRVSSLTAKVGPATTDSESDDAKALQAVKEMQQIAQGLEAYSAVTGKTLPAVASIADLRSYIVPTYAARIRPDPWGRSYRFVRSPSNERVYAVVCAGSDGIFQRIDYFQPGAAYSHAGPADDIIFVGGVMYQGPH